MATYPDTPPASGVRVEAGLLPWPKAIGSEARLALARLVMPDGSRFPSPPLPSLDDTAGWITNRDMTDPMIAARLAAAPVEGTSAEIAEIAEIAGVRVHIAVPDASMWENRAFLHIHGGAWIYGGGAFCRQTAMRMAATTGLRTYGIDYRKPPEHPFPAALDDCMALYRVLIERYGAQNVVVGGGSAGGNLAAALALRARDEQLLPPAGVVLLTPVLDCLETGDSAQVNAAADVVLSGLTPLISLYAGSAPLDHPYLSPLYGDLAKGFPPTFLQAGTRDVLLSDSVRMHRALCEAGLQAELHVFEGMPHGGFGGGAPEDVALDRAVARFVACLWPA